MSMTWNYAWGLMPVKEIYANGHDLGIAKMYISRFYNQANIAGSGLDWAEDKIKAKGENPYLVPEDHVA